MLAISALAMDAISAHIAARMAAIMPRELDQPQDAVDTALTAVMDLDVRLRRLAGHMRASHIPGAEDPRYFVNPE